jgi:acyl-coenzyme A synthetase/AMP-(fatty) acid ligase/pimeloyl-ACP methyl ester carboxylesterase
LWSRLFHELKSDVRLIAPDHLAMGYSQNTGPRTYETRVKDIEDLLRALNISEPVWIVAQDWGGALAMGYAVAHPNSVAGLLLSNTGIAIPHGRRAPLLIKISAASGLHQFITQRTPLFVKGTPLLPGHSLSKVQRKALGAPYKNAYARQGVAGFVAEVPFNAQHQNHSVLDGIAEQLPQLNIPVRLIWGSKDPVFNDDFADDLVHRFRNVALHRIAQAGHLAVLETSIASFVEDAMQDTSVQKLPALSLGEPEPLWGRLEQANREHELAVHDATAQESVTFGEFSARVATYAQELHRQGVQRGQRIAVLVPPSVDLIAVVYAAWRIGAVTVIADRGLGLRGLGNAVRSARVQHVVGPQKALLAARALRCAPHATFIALNELQGAKKLESLAELYVQQPQPQDLAAVLFTSGATGPAKGVRYTHQQLCAQRDALQKLYSITRTDRFVAAFAPFALYGPALGICTGLANMDVTAPRTLTAQALNEACENIQATMVFASPAALANVLATAPAVNTEALSKVRLVMSAGAPVPIETLRAMKTLCPQAELHTPYGMTELLPLADISLAVREDIGSDQLGSGGVCVGTAVEGCDVVVAAPGAGQEVVPLAAGITGEILASAPWMSDGYDRLWHTQTAARPVRPGAARTWHRTGDVGHLDIAGNIWVEGRVVHVIHAVDGAITPVPLEIATEEVPEVLRAAAVGVGPHGVAQVVVVVETTNGNEGEASPELTAKVRLAVAPQKIAAVWVVKELPVDIRHNAKIDRTALANKMSVLLSGAKK